MARQRLELHAARMPSRSSCPNCEGAWVAMALNGIVLAAVAFIVLWDSMSFVRTVETTVAGWLGLPSSAVPSHVTCAAEPQPEN